MSSPTPYYHPARLLDRYVIRRKLGSGSLGTVYLVHDQASGREVALKLIRADRLTPEAVARLQKEFQAVAGLHHPQIATAFDFGYTEDRTLPFYTREYIEGTPLPPGPPAGAPPREFLSPILDLLDALEYLHAHGILHLDIHPGNLIVARDRARGSVLIDFGLIRTLEGPRLSTSGESLSGMPPEMLQGGAASPASDLFLVGRLILWRLCGEAGVEARLPREIPGWGPRRTLEIERIAGKALKTDPGGRFQSAGEFRAALLEALGGSEPRRANLEPGEVTVGREAELDRIDRLLHHVAGGRTAVLWIAGPPGSGKSRLLAEARQRAQLLGLEVIAARFFPDPGHGPGLRATLEIAGAGRKSRLRWLDPLEPARGGAPEERARRAARAYFEESGKPVVLCLDDLDLADGESRTLAEALLIECAERREREGRGLAICASAAHPPKELASRRDLLVLKPLPAREAGKLLGLLSRPLHIPETLARRAAAEAHGSPLLIRRIARTFLAEWGPAGRVPLAAEIPECPSFPLAGGLLDLQDLAPVDREIIRALSVARRPARDDELAAVLGIEPLACRRSLLRLRKAEVLLDRRRGRARLFWLNQPGATEEPSGGVSRVEVRRIHRRFAEHLAGRPALDLPDRENLARHLLLSGNRTAGLELAFSVACQLRRQGSFDRAARLLEAALPQAKGAPARFALAEEISAILEENGDHRKGIEILEPFYKSGVGRLSPRQAIRLGRRLGVHYHRSGRADEAMRIFEETQRLANPERDLEDLVFIDSEIAELSNLRGRSDEAEEACRRGFERLRSLRSEDDFKARMELTLRATQGHLELRRLRIPEARRELARALKLSRRLELPALEAVILNHLGIAENHLNRFPEARACFHGAEKLLLAAGERRPVVSIACNLAVIAAKLGEREEAHVQVERAAKLLRHSPGKRLEFFAAYTRGTVAAILGDAGTVLEVLPRVLPLGRQVGDHYLTRFGEVYLAEALIACGRYGQALKQLDSTAREAAKFGPPILARMVHSRLILLAALLGHRRLLRKSRDRIESIPRTDIHLLEAWSSTFLGFAEVLSGEGGLADLQAARETFLDLKVVFGERFARLGLLLHALRRRDGPAIVSLLREFEADPPPAQRYLAVAIPLACAEASFFQGDLERARERLSEASGAIVGSPFLELDWRIELLRANLALKAGDPAAAREHVHRSLHTRDLLLQFVPASHRERVVMHPRFEALNRLAERLERSPRVFLSSNRLRATGIYEGMVGRSKDMVQVFRTIERLRDQEMPVLITGETGTGKELVARALHRASPRAKGQFFAVHCASLPVALFESELFGYEAGAFSGAEEGRTGLLESLAGGTLLLDGVSELPREAQAKLLRVIDSGAARRVGGVEERPVDVRFLAAAGTDLDSLVAARSFREDLYYRLKGMEIRLPPLSQRREDIEPLARHFLEKHARRLDRPVPALGGEALRLLETWRWPGNVRELETAILRALVSPASPDVLQARDLEPFLGSGQASSNATSTEMLGIDEKIREDRPLEELKLELERAYLTRLFHRLDGDLRRIMEVLGVKQSYFYSWLRKVGLDIRSLRRERP